MYWAPSLLAVTAAYAAVKLFLFSREKNSLKYIGLSLAGLALLVTQISIVLESIVKTYGLTIYPDLFVEWGHVLCISLVLCSLALFIRESKPVFAQFPMVYTALPLLIVVSHILVIDTYAMKEWLISIYQGGALLVATLMYGVYTYRNHQYGWVLLSMIGFLITYIAFWHVPGVADVYAWIWRVLTAISVITFVKGLERIQQQVHEKQPEQL